MRRLLALAAGFVALVTAASAQAPDPALLREMAPTGRLRAAINHGNPVLAARDQASGELSGVTADLAQELARRLGVPLDLVGIETAGKVTASASSGVWDVAFLAIDPVRAAEIEFTPPYVVIEGTYAVPDGSALREIADVDREGVRISVARDSAYDLFLTRAIRRATLVRVATSPDAIRHFLDAKLEAVAGVKQPIVRFARETPGIRAMDGRFMRIDQAMGSPKGRALAARYLTDFVEDVKASGFVASALQRHAQPDAVVAPPGPAR